MIPRRTRPDTDQRRRALEAVAAEAAARRAPAGEAAVAVAPYGDGFLAIAVAGIVEERSAELLAGVLRDCGTLGRHELDVELGGLVRSSPTLVRFLGYLRLQQVTGGGRLELHRPPADLVNALGDCPDQLSVHHARPALRAL
jgi:hypothetical protein